MGSMAASWGLSFAGTESRWNGHCAVPLLFLAFVSCLLWVHTSAIGRLARISSRRWTKEVSSLTTSSLQDALLPRRTVFLPMWSEFSTIFPRLKLPHAEQVSRWGWRQ